MDSLLEFIRIHRGFDFTNYKRSTLNRRIERRMAAVEVADFEAYREYLETHPREFHRLFDALLIKVTSFFREPATWDCFATEVLPLIAKGKADGQPIRVWIPGCATGEEAYTLAILLAESLGVEEYLERVKIYASDMDETALGTARQATYSEKDLEGVPEPLRAKYFEPAGSGRRVFRSDLRPAVIFGRLNLVKDAPISRVDLVSCRNTLMYFNIELQSRVLALFHFALKDPGFLVLGKAEMLLTHGNLFSPVALKHRIFRKVPAANMYDRLFVMSQTGGRTSVARDESRGELREAAFDVEPYADVVVDHNGQLALANAQARRMFNLTNKDMGQPFENLTPARQSPDLVPMIRKVEKDLEQRTLTGVRYLQPTGDTQYLDITVTPVLSAEEVVLGVNITFQDVTANRGLREDLQHSREEVETAYEELQASNEELETTNEELQSTVEELESTNEELQSGNEELQSMNEELQAGNEELQTMNEELHHRGGELEQVRDFLGTLLGSLPMAVVLVNKDMQVQAWTAGAEEMWGLRSSEVVGQSFLDLDIGLRLKDFDEDLQRCIRGEGKRVERALEAVDRRGRTIHCRVICGPLTDESGLPRGAILTMESLDGE